MKLRADRCLAFLLTCLALFATPAFADQKPSAESAKFRQYRHAVTEPSYGLAKVKALIKRIKEDQDMNLRLAAKEFSRLTPQEKFTYTMLHGEDFSQNCAETSPLEDERNKIFSYFPGAFGDEAGWSDRQLTFLSKDRPLVVKLLRSTIKSHKRIGINLKETIVQINGVELIPELLASYRRDSRDNDILTVLLLLMKEKKYKPFLSTPLYKEFYGEDANYGVFKTATPSVKKQIQDLASAFARKR